jgi:hypothetical protein
MRTDLRLPLSCVLARIQLLIIVIVLVPSHLRVAYIFKLVLCRHISLIFRRDVAVGLGVVLAI